MNREHVYGRSGGRWAATGIQRLVNGRYYLGYFRGGGEWRKGTHPPIITQETWDAAQALAQAGAQQRLATARPGRRPARHLFINGLLRCMFCMGAIIPRSDGEDRYVCSSNRQKAGSCPMPTFPRAEVDGRFLAIFEQDYLDLDATREHVAAQLDQDLRDAQEQLPAADLEVASIERQLARIEADYLAETLSAAAYERLGAKLTGGAGRSRGWA